ncbi:hypothetical protein [Streptomyces sp. NPDC057636]|uniref:hypothetical protein n=1 Tax=Streptomyces sp. NPDC057636 TaxID=3346189 RepID=UPI00367F43DE
MDFPPVINGLDFLESTVTLLTERTTPPPRNLKYSVVHLAAAVEALLKVRLEIEDRQLTWAEPAEYVDAKHQAGNFRSAAPAVTLKRVAQSCKPTTTLTAKRRITAPARMRNRIAHFGLTEKRAAVEVLTTPVLDFLVTFVHDDLLGLIPEAPSARADDILERVRPARGGHTLVDQRMAPARELRDKRWAHILPCPRWEAWYAGGGQNRIVGDRETERFYNAVHPGPGMAAADIGCGTGRWTRQLSR